MKTTINLILFLALAWSTANTQVGIGITILKDDAVLDVESIIKGFLPPRMDNAERIAISSPAAGLTIYNKEVNCLQWYNGTGWFDACSGSTFGNIPGNATCETATISVTPCSAVSGATENATQPHADGTLYDWTEAGSYMSGGTTEALVEIGGQCWFGRNTIVKPTAPISADPNVAPNEWGATTVNDEGYWGYYNTANNNSWGTAENATGEGLLYQWSAAMNGVSGTAAERAQGVCPTGWHVPSDCEWMYLENSLGMSTAFGFFSWYLFYG